MSRSRVWRTVVAAAVAVSTTLLGPSPGAWAAPGDPADAYGSVLNVLPPGQAGNNSAARLAEVLAKDPENRYADGTTPRNFANQLEMYDRLNTADPAQVTELSPYFKKASFTPECDGPCTVRTFPDRPGLTITWDRYGVPFIKGRSARDVYFGAGYAGTLERMFLQDVLRNTGAARSAEFLGPTEDNIAMDQEMLRSAPYTDAEADAQIAAVKERYGEEGERLVSGLDGYVAGINAAQDKLCPAGAATGPECPSEYAALQRTPKKWERSDVVHVAGLLGGIFGKGGGAEYGNAMWFQKLREKYGEDEARKVYDDLRHKNDPEAPTTSTREAPYGGSGGIDPGRAGVAMPDLRPAATAGGTGTRVENGGLPDLGNLLGKKSPGTLDLPKGKLDLGKVSRGMSNAALIAGNRTRDGHPLAVFGPQTGYFAPQLWTEQVLDGPGIKSRGVGFAGTNLVVQVGRGTDYAWSPTSSSSDIVDTVVEPLCEPGGGEPTVESEGYLRDGRCEPMRKRIHEETALPTAAGQAPPQHLKFLVLRTHHGIVQLRTTVDGEPVAIVTQRSSYEHEVDSVVAFSRLNNPDVVRDAPSFQRALEAMDLTFNWHYADDRDIAYYSSGLLPRRSDEVEFDLPRWGDSTYDWQGFEPFRTHPMEINPPTGYLVSWNNKPAPAFAAADDTWGYGPVHRSLALSDRLSGMAEKGDATPQSLLGGVQDAATVDSRAFYVLPRLLRVIGDDPSLAEPAALLRAWLADGAHRVDRDRDGSYSHQAAIALFDAWWQSESDGVAKDVLRGGLGSLADDLPKGLDDHPRQGRGSAWNGVPWYGYVDKDLRKASGLPVREWHRSYCGDGSLEACRAALRGSLSDAVRRVLSKQGKARVGELTYDKHTDDIRSVAVGLTGVRPVDWQNRPTFQQVVQFTGGRRE